MPLSAKLEQLKLARAAQAASKAAAAQAAVKTTQPLTKTMQHVEAVLAAQAEGGHKKAAAARKLALASLGVSKTSSAAPKAVAASQAVSASDFISHLKTTGVKARDL